MKNKIIQIIPVVSVVAILVVWQILAMAINAEIIMPSPKLTFKHFITFFSQKSFYSAVFGSLLRTVISFSIALILAVLCAVLASISKVTEQLLYPFVLLFRAVPTMSVIFLCIIWFGQKLSPIFVCFFIIFPILYVTVLSKIKGCDTEVQEMSNAFLVPKRVQFTQFYLPTVVKYSFDDIVSTLSFSVKLVISAEALSRTRESLGFMMTISKEALETAELFAYTVACVILSFLLELLFKLIKKLARRFWYGKS